MTYSVEDKYTPEELKEKAMTFLKYDGAGDPRADWILHSLSQYYKIPIQQVRDKIRELAQYEQSD